MEHGDGTDKGIGVAMALGVVAFLGAGVMFAGGTQLFQAWGFAAAVIAASLAVVALQIYDA
ncbi:hypothetical protein EGH24_10195 [Halonotius terrestris]|uniref:Uncharacterized protein n=1 Tax=Halonotius terrestris TaxID=2487750 RepID=A0A8J8TC78_9EURY|nr:hypothetical protein [Halonotius terrestris]TQQ79849.1 hypothetical protein EGH24_10195 [Halonotius terrestris]